MAIPCYTLAPRNDVTEEQYRRLEKLLHDLFLILGSLFNMGATPSYRRQQQDQSPQPPPTGGAGIGGNYPYFASRQNYFDTLYRSIPHQLPVRAPINVHQPSNLQILRNKPNNERMSVQLQRNGTINIIGGDDIATSAATA